MTSSQRTARIASILLLAASAACAFPVYSRSWTDEDPCSCDLRAEDRGPGCEDVACDSASEDNDDDWRSPSDNQLAVEEGGSCRFAEDCARSARCIEGVCVARCTSDSQCGPGLRCLAGACQASPAPECVIDEDCASDSACADGFCRRQCAGVRDALIYLVTDRGELWSFDPTRPGTDAYQLVNALDCEPDSAPQTMAVDRTGLARVFYNSGDLFEVSTTSARCRPTSYQHPQRRQFNELGMAFTSTSPGSGEETLYMQSGVLGLVNVDPRTYEVHSERAFVGRTAELSGGADGRLFVFDARAGTLSETNRHDHSETVIAEFPELGDVHAFAFARWGERFFLFTADGTTNGTTTTEFDTRTGVAHARDAQLWFTVVGAGRSTCPVKDNL